MSEVDWTLYLRAPAFDVAGGVGLGHGLLVALPKAMPATVKAAAKKLRHDVDALKEAWRPAVFKAKEERVDLRSLDTKYDATWRAVRDRLVAVDVLDDELDAVEKVDAKLLYESLFGGGSEFLNGQGKKQWAACEARIDALEKAGLVTKVEHVVGAPYWRQLKTQHEAYGQATGATKAVAADDPSTSLLGPLRDLQRSMGDYLLQIVAAVKNDATLETHARAAVAPVDEHRASAVRAGKSTAPAVTPDTPTPEIPID